MVLWLPKRLTYVTSSDLTILKKGDIFHVSIAVGGFISLLINLRYICLLVKFYRGFRIVFIFRCDSWLILTVLSVISNLSLIIRFQFLGMAEIRLLYFICDMSQFVVCFNCVK